MATSCLLKTKGFLNKGYEVVIYVDGVANKVLLRDSNCVLSVVM